MIDLPPPSYEQTIQANQSCGVTSSNIRIKYEDFLQSDEVTISDIGEVTESKLRCVRRAVHPFYILTLAKSEQRSAFYDLARKDDFPEQRQKAREWIQAKGWTARIPAFDENQGIELFAQTLERACELKAGSVLSSNGSHFLIVRPELFTKANFRASGKAVECLMNMAVASNAEEHGIQFGFMGNEAFVKDKN